METTRSLLLPQVERTSGGLTPPPPTAGGRPATQNDNIFGIFTNAAVTVPTPPPGLENYSRRNDNGLGNMTEVTRDKHIQPTTMTTELKSNDALQMLVNKGREAETIKIGTFPSAPQAAGWLMQLEDNFRAASGRGDDGWRFIRQVRKPEITTDELECTREWETIDAKLLTALMTPGFLRGELRRKMTEEQTRRSRLDKTFVGDRH